MLKQLRCFNKQAKVRPAFLGLFAQACLKAMPRVGVMVLVRARHRAALHGRPALAGKDAGAVAHPPKVPAGSCPHVPDAAVVLRVPDDQLGAAPHPLMAFSCGDPTGGPDSPASPPQGRKESPAPCPGAGAPCLP